MNAIAQIELDSPPGPISFRRPHFDPPLFPSLLPVAPSNVMAMAPEPADTIVSRDLGSSRAQVVAHPYCLVEPSRSLEALPLRSDTLSKSWLSGFTVLTQSRPTTSYRFLHTTYIRSR